MRAVRKQAALVLCSLFAVLLILEGGIRLYSAFWFPRMMQLDAQLGWKHTPNVRKVFVNEFGEKVEVRQNQYGHRGRAYPIAKNPKKLRILVLGDSFTEGIQVGEDDLFTAFLERSNPRLEVLNAGVGGYGTVQEYLYLETAGLKHNPNLVLLMVFENDLADNCLHAYPGFGPRPYAVLRAQSVQIVRDSESQEFLKYALPVPFANALNQHSYLFYFLNNNVYHRLRATHVRELQKADLKRTDECGRYDVMFGMIRQMAQLVTMHNVRLALVLIPTREQVEQGNAATLQPIIDYCERERIAYLSLLGRFRKDMDRSPPYFPRDIHWTKAGHRLAAEEISLFLKNMMPQIIQEQIVDGRE